ncbi:MAG: hypothetical protein KDD46_08560 [Bdellovibrionales bacterium]|nr:hypothetical protein [Bdellovibrionales bacterium]
MFTYLVCLFVAGSAFAQMGSTTKGLKDLQPGQKQETTQVPAKEKSKPKSTTPTKPKVETSPIVEETKKSANTIVLSQLFFEDAIIENWPSIVSYEGYNQLLTRIKEKPAYVSPKKITSGFKLDGSKIVFHALSDQVLDDGTPIAEKAFSIKLVSAELAKKFEDSLKNDACVSYSLIVPQSEKEIEVERVIIVLHETKQVQSLYTYLDHIDGSSEDVFGKTDQGKKIINGFDTYLENVTEYYDDEYDCGVADENQPEEIKEYCKVFPESGRVFAICTNEALEESSWPNINLDSTILPKVRTACYRSSLWNEYMYQRFLDRDLSEFSSW